MMKVTLTIEATTLEEIKALLDSQVTACATPAAKPEEKAPAQEPAEIPGEEDAPKEDVVEEKKPATRSRAKATTMKKVEDAPAIEEEKEEDEKPEEVKKEKPLTIEAVREQIAVKIEANAKFREPIKALVTKYESKNVSALLPKHFDNFITDLNALK